MTVFSARETVLASNGKMDVRIRDLFVSLPSFTITNSFSLQTEQASAVTAEIVACKKRILSIIEKGKVQKDEEVLRMQYFIHTLQVFEAEFLTRAKIWDQIPRLVQASFHLVDLPLLIK